MRIGLGSGLGVTSTTERTDAQTPSSGNWALWSARLAPLDSLRLWHLPSSMESSARQQHHRKRAGSVQLVDRITSSTHAGVQ